jgi:putative CocE/NonD family hydrolase
MLRRGRHLPSLLLLAIVLPAVAPVTALAEDTPAKKNYSYARKTHEVEMRDGVKLHTVIVAPTNAGDEKLPFVIERTPYSADSGAGAVRSSLRELADEGYIFVFQDIRGRYQSGGTFVMMRPPHDPADTKGVDEGTDTFDTIAWLLTSQPNNNGRAGMLGISYPGWLTVMAMVDPHPALKAVSPQASPDDMFIGDDFHRNGAFRLSYGFEYVAMMETGKQNFQFNFDTRDTFNWYLKLGSLTNVNKKYFKGERPTWNDFVKHPDYDAFWKKESSHMYLNKVKVPALHVGGWWDQEDYLGPLKIYEKLEKEDPNNKNFLVVGPWNHGGWAGGPGSSLGAINFHSPTSRYFREKVQAPWFAFHLKDKGKLDLPEALLFQTGSNEWKRYDVWPPNKNVALRKLHFQPKGGLAFDPPRATRENGFDSYVSDPAHPVPYRSRPVEATYSAGSRWYTWEVEDQRFVDNRPDVLTYQTPPLENDLVVEGDIVAHLFATTSGSDCDWIVKLIDVYPDDTSEGIRMAGYELMITGDVLRSRFLNGLDKPEALKPGQVYDFPVPLHWINHCFKKGHRIMVQVQSTWFPVIDRNPQKFVKNIFEAEDSDYQKAEQKVYHAAPYPSYISLPGPAKQ